MMRKYRCWAGKHGIISPPHTKNNEFLYRVCIFVPCRTDLLVLPASPDLSTFSDWFSALPRSRSLKVVAGLQDEVLRLFLWPPPLHLAPAAPQPLTPPWRSPNSGGWRRPGRPLLLFLKTSRATKIHGTFSFLLLLFVFIIYSKKKSIDYLFALWFLKRNFLRHQCCDWCFFQVCIKITFFALRWALVIITVLKKERHSITVEMRNALTLMVQTH